MKEFVTAVKAGGREVSDEVTVKIDDQEVTFAAPSPEQLAILIASVSATGNDLVGIAEIINVFFDLIEDPDIYRSLRHRLFDREDEFGVDELTDILLYLIEEWTGRPTQQPSDYLPSRKAGGRRSTARQPRTALTPST
jgi:hypothetical protein